VAATPSALRFYTAPSGREITLAYWTAGHFVSGPEIFGGGEHIWSADVARSYRLLHLPGSAIRELIETLPSFAVCLIEGLVAKGKCYSALAQMLGTRSVVERLAHLLVILAENHWRRDGNRLVIERKITHDQIATIIGSTRQWVTITLDKFQKKGIISVARQIDRDRAVRSVSGPNDLRIGFDKRRTWNDIIYTD
jgi:CRP/FNR family cyclic AMP-dependent transcriptional regulator